MKLRMFQVDAFTNRLFGGNPAAVVLLEKDIADGTLQSIAAENNLSETAFVLRSAEHWSLRWFTPVVEVDLCGHATLATAHVLFREGLNDSETLTFLTAGGELRVRREQDQLCMDFPSRPTSRNGPLRGNCHRARQRRGLCLSVLCTPGRGSRGPSDRIGTLHAHTVLGASAG